MFKIVKLNKLYQWQIYRDKFQMHALPLIPIFFHFQAVFKKIWLNNRLAPPAPLPFGVSTSPLFIDHRKHRKRNIQYYLITHVIFQCKDQSPLANIIMTIIFANIIQRTEAENVQQSKYSA